MAEVGGKKGEDRRGKPYTYKTVQWKIKVTVKKPLFCAPAILTAQYLRHAK